MKWLISELAMRLAADTSRLGATHRQLVDVWNRGLASKFVDSCITATLRHLTENDPRSIPLRNLANETQRKFDRSAPLKETIAEFIHNFDGALVEPTERNRLDGSEQTVDQLPTHFRGLFGSDEKGLAKFSRNWKVLGKLASDPRQQLIGDASIVVAAFHPEVYELTTSGFGYKNTSRGWQGGLDKNVETDSVSVITGVADRPQLVALLTPVTLGLERHPGR